MMRIGLFLATNMAVLFVIGLLITALHGLKALNIRLV